MDRMQHAKLFTACGVGDGLSMLRVSSLEGVGQCFTGDMLLSDAWQTIRSLLYPVRASAAIHGFMKNAILQVGRGALSMLFPKMFGVEAQMQVHRVQPFC